MKRPLLLALALSLVACGEDAPPVDAPAPFGVPYVFVSEGPTAWASNPSQGYGVTLDAAGAHLRGQAGDWQLSLRTAGHDGIPRPVGDRIEISSDRLTEWFTNGPEGLRQGWTVPTSGDEVVIDVVTDAAVRIAADGRSARLAAGGHALRYADLRAWDGLGRALDSAMEVGPGGIRIRVQTVGAVWPVTVDPVLTTSVWTVAGGLPNELLGAAVQGIGDVNADGYEDVLVGSPGSGTGGAVSLFLGGPAGPSTTAVWSTISVDGCDFGGRLGRIGDVNGDGFDDFAVGDDCAGSVTAPGEGRVHVWYGSVTPSTLPLESHWLAVGLSGNARLGRSMAGLNVDGDAYGDLVVGAPGLGPGGSVRVYLGGATGLGFTAAATISENQTNAEAGTSVANAGDVNDDGRDDLLIGAPQFDAPVAGTDAGRVQLFLATGTSPPFASALWAHYGENSADRLGTTVAGAGDVDGDGGPDLAAGSPNWDRSGDESVGRVYVWRTSGGNVVLIPATYDGVNAQDTFGNELASVGDVNGDGFADLGVGAPGDDTYSVQLGGPAGLESAPSFVGVGSFESSAGAIAGAGDVNGDGIPDVIVGAPFDGVNDEGSAEIHLGSRAGPSELVGDTVGGTSPGDNFGVAVAGVGDVNGDGYDDVLVGAHNYENGEAGEGAAFLYLGTDAGLDLSAPAWSAEGNSAGANFGESVGPAGDVNGDGFADWIVGAPDYSTLAFAGVGQVTVYYGSASVAGTGPGFQAEGTVTNMRLGSAVGGGGDVNGDGFGDIVVGARLYTGGESNEGQVLVWFGGPLGPVSTADWSAESDVTSAQLGSSVALIGDVNGDGFAEVAAGAPQYDDALGDAGAVFVWHGSITGPGASPDWSYGGQQSLGFNALGTSVAGAGDVQGDGLDDLLVGDPLAGLGASNEGRALLFDGQTTATGLTATFSWNVGGVQANAAAGTSVAGAGDVNGDGFGDLAIGIPGFGSGGMVRVYPGGPAVALNPMFTKMGPQSGQALGNAVAGAGDTDGDGVDDLLAGSWFFDQTSGGNEGRIIVYPGNASDGRGRHPRPPAVGLTDSAGLPVPAWGRTVATTTATVSAVLARGVFGPGEIALEAEFKTIGASFDGVGTVVSSWTAVGVTGGALSVTDATLTENTVMHWRARLLYRGTRARAQRWGPWVHGGRGSALGVHFRTGCADDFDGDGFCDADDFDDDNDGSVDTVDCNDFDPTVYPPDAPEACDGVDSDCDGSLVDGFDDFDGDGDPDCNDADDDGDLEPDVDDCAPFDPTAFTGNPEVCDGVDNDCDGVVPADEADADGDAWRVCDGDCDDALDSVFPGAPEALDCVDTDCDGTIPASETADTDLDGSPACLDCLDSDPTVRPGAVERCDGQDTDCDGVIDLDGLFTGEDDADGDGFNECAGDCNDGNADKYPGAPELASAIEDFNCDGVFGVLDGDGDGSTIEDAEPDCDDGDPARFPGNPEICDGIDNDCDGLLLSETADGDGDGYLACEDCHEADPAIPTTDNLNREVCDGWNSDCDPEGYPDPDTDDYDVDGDGVAVCEGDCDDADPAVSPTAPEVCGNERDEDCDGVVDEDVDEDADGVTTCDGDCDDSDAARVPGAPETCDGVDEDCDGLVDEDFDRDDDGVPDCGDGLGDCDDDDPATWPGAPEDCTDGRDNDCDPATDPFVDGDGDGFAPCPGGDCDDTSDAVSPGHVEVCDGIDNDCDGDVDEDLDLDNDGLVWCTGDCAEGDPGVRAGMVEICGDGIDQDCNPTTLDECPNPGDEELDIVFPAGCVCDTSSSAEGVELALVLALGLIVRRRRVRR